MIDEFRGEYDFLSNFSPSRIVIDRIAYPTVEHAFQAAKTKERVDKKIIAELPSPGSAKRMGKRVKLRPDWESVKVGIMEELVRLKFKDPDLAQQLLATGEEKLVEGNSWNDRFWGVSGGAGKNHLGRILMKVRDELRQSAGLTDMDDSVKPTGSVE